MPETKTQVADGAFRAHGKAVLFGFDSTPVEVVLMPRSRGWRMAGAARAMGLALVIVPFVAVVPPHAPWVVGVLATGVIFARRRWTEHYSLLEISGRCPKCSAPIRTKGGRLRQPHPLPCDTCHHDSALRLSDGALDGEASPEG